jgi:tetratricopeptide (TPR) repeat protein
MKPGRNDPCPCGSGKRYKHCCGAPGAAAAPDLNPHELVALAAMIHDGRLGQAERRLLALLENHPSDGTLWKFLSVALLRQGKDEALPALRRAAELLPHDAEAHGNLGAALHDSRQWEAALASLRRSLTLQPRNPGVLIDAANALRALSRPREALPLYQSALQLDARSAEAHNNLGNAYLELGQPADAAACYRRALDIKPRDAQIHCNLANALRQLGQIAEAVACSQRAIELDPRLSAAHNNLGMLLAAQGRRAEAIASYRQALALNPSYVEALNNLGNVLRELGERREALALYRQAIDLDPQRADSHCNLGTALFELRRIADAEASFRRALALPEKYSEARVGLAAVLRVQGRTAEAEASCQAALAEDPQSAGAASMLGELRADRGRFAEAQELFQRAITADPSFATAYCGVAQHRRMTSADSDWRQGVETLLARPLPLGQEISLRYALGKYFDDIGQYDAAFDNFRRANELSKRYDSSYDRAKLTQRVDRIIATFDMELLRQRRPGASDSELPVFIVGMPRSGTSLTEQILASHPAVYGAGEVRFWHEAFTALEKAGFGSDNAVSLLPGMARDYLARVTASSGASARVIDKMPANFLYAGLIHAALPRARILHMQRHPLDTCVSIYFQSFFNMGPFANDFDNLAHYYREYLRVTAHWRAVLPATALLEIPYEALIADQEGWTRRTLDFIGLPWDPKCLDFHETDRVVITASKWQVRQRINATSAGRWRNYEKHLGPLQHLVELVEAAGATAGGSVAQPMRVASSRPSSSA